MKVEQGNYVEVHYTGTLDDGIEFDSSQGKEPLKVLQGNGMLIKGFDDALLAMQEGESKTFTLQSSDAYGDRRDDLIKEIPRSELPEDITPEAGMTLGVRSPEGHVFPATITQVTDDHILLDANHPLAGKALTFAISIVATRQPTEDDMKQFQHDHVHDEHCNHDDEPVQDEQ